MRNLLFAYSALTGVALLTLPANAADLAADYYAAESQTARVVPAETMRDRFCDAYAGVQVGYLWGSDNYSGLAETGMDPYLEEGKNDGVSGGFYAGCNWNRQGPVLFGVEGDINLADVGVGDDNWYGTLRLRVGPTNGTTLLYATGGVAFGQIDMSTPSGWIGGGLDVDVPVAFGWTVGAGIEHWFSDRVSWKTEYLYLDLGEVGTVSVSGTEALSSEWEAHTVRTGLAVHF